MRLRLGSALLGACLFLGVAGPFQSEASACSCAPATAEEIYEGSRASFIGVLEGVRRKGSNGGRYHYEVRESFKRDLGSHVVVRAALQGSACGLAKTPGRRIALGLDGKPGRWTSGSCSRTSARGLRAAAKKDRRGEEVALGPDRCGAAKTTTLTVIRRIVSLVGAFT